MNGGYIPDDARSHISQMSTRSRPRSIGDGRSEHGLFGNQGVAYQSKYHSSRNGKPIGPCIDFFSTATNMPITS